MSRTVRAALERKVRIGAHVSYRDLAGFGRRYVDASEEELVGDVLEVVRAEALAGMTMVLATHEMAFARDVATRVCFLDRGRILEEGPPEQVLVDPREERTRQFLRRVLPG